KDEQQAHQFPKEPQLPANRLPAQTDAGAV
ncbi:hypothetical protein EVA_15484, partial [gut metagenome]